MNEEQWESLGVLPTDSNFLKELKKLVIRTNAQGNGKTAPKFLSDLSEAQIFLHTIEEKLFYLYKAYLKVLEENDSK